MENILKPIEDDILYTCAKCNLYACVNCYQKKLKILTMKLVKL